MADATILPTNPGASCARYRKGIDTAVKRVLDSGWYVLGEEVEAFERAFADFGGTNYALGVASGTDALIVAMKLLGIGRGDAVLTVSHTAVATVAAIELVGAVPVLIDIDPMTFTMDPAALADVLAEWKANPNLFGKAVPKAIVPVHIYGQMADMPAIMDIARDFDLKVIEDCAQAHGASLNGKNAGTWGDAAAFSFYPTKNLGAIGDGGAIAFNDSDFAAAGKMIREYGWKDRQSVIPGMNSRLDELQAAILRVKLEGLAADNQARRDIADIYTRELSNLVAVPANRPGQTISHVYHQYVIRTPRRDELRAYLREEKDIITLIHYPQAVHQQPAYSNRPLTAGRQLSATETVCSEILSLPMYPELPQADVDRVCRAIQAFFE